MEGDGPWNPHGTVMDSRHALECALGYSHRFVTELPSSLGDHRGTGLAPLAERQVAAATDRFFLT